MKASVDIVLHDLGGNLIKQRVHSGVTTELAPVTMFTIGIDMLYVVEQSTREVAEVQGAEDQAGQADGRGHSSGDLDMLLNGDANQGWTDRQQVLDMIGRAEGARVLTSNSPCPRSGSTISP